MTLELKYSVANKLADAFRPTIGTSFHVQDQHTQFGIILNKPFSSKGRVVTIKSLYSDQEVAFHITNLVRHRLIDSDIPEVDL